MEAVSNGWPDFLVAYQEYEESSESKTGWTPLGWFLADGTPLPEDFVMHYALWENKYGLITKATFKPYYYV